MKPQLKFLAVVVIVTLLALSLLGAQKAPHKPPKPSPSPTVTPTPVVTPTPTPTPVPTTTPTPTPTPEPSPSPSSHSLTLITANIAHGEGTDNQFRDPAMTIPVADVILMQEVADGDVGRYDTGFAQRGMSRAVYFPNSTGPNNTGDGQAIYYDPNKVTVASTYTHPLSTGFISWDGSTNVDKSAVAVEIVVSGRSLVIVNAHLCWSRCADSQGDIETTGYSSQREAQIGELLSWVEATFPGKPRVIGGDMNLTREFLRRAGGRQIDLFTASYIDLWAQGLTTGISVADYGDRNGDGLSDMPLSAARTADLRFIDYWFLSQNSNIGVSRVEVLDTRAQCPHTLVEGGAWPSCAPEVVKQWDSPDDFGWRPSDHNWLRLVLQF